MFGWTSPHKSPEFITEHFPTLYARLLELGIDITKDMIPVVPAAHYTCGGVVVDEHSQTDLDGLYTIGETSYTGLHGANHVPVTHCLNVSFMAKCSRRYSNKHNVSFEFWMYRLGMNLK